MNQPVLQIESNGETPLRVSGRASPQARAMARVRWVPVAPRLGARSGARPQHSADPSESAVTSERKRLAREIHDTLVQEFAGILLHLEAARTCDASAPDEISKCLAHVRELAKCGLEDARRMLLGLRPRALDGAQLAVALRQLAEGFSRDCGIACSFRTSGRANELPERVQDELYRAAQEALCNVRKHARARSVSILLRNHSQGVVLVIKDNGQGFVATQRPAGAHGFGLPGMCDRANRLGGRMDINTAPGNGTELRLTVPLPDGTSMERIKV